MIKFERPSPKLLTIGFGFWVATLALAYTLSRSLTTFTLSKEAFLSALPVLLFLCLTASLAIIFALVEGRKAMALGVVVAALLFALPLTSLPLLWRLLTSLTFFFGSFLLCLQAQKTHEVYTGFSASHFKGVVRNFFLLFVFILGIVLFSTSSQALKRFSTAAGFEIPEETLEPVVGQFVGMIGGMLRQQTGGRVPERELAPYVEEQLTQLLHQMKVELKLEGQPESFAQVTERITKSLKAELGKMVTPFKAYIPFLIAGIAVLTLFTLSPFVALIGSFVFFLLYRLLVLVRILKLEEVERKVKRLALA